MFVVLIYLSILAVAAVLTFAAFGDVSRTTPPAEGSRDFFTYAHSSVTKGDTGSEGSPSSEAAAAAAPATPKRRIFAVDSPFVKAAHLPPQQQRMLAFLEDHCPALPVRAAGATVLTHPSKFYEELKAQIRKTKKSVFFSALYIGDGPLSKSFVAALEEKVEEVVAQHDAQCAAATTTTDSTTPARSACEVTPFEIGILLDYNRMHDRKNLVTVHKLLAMSHALEFKYNQSASPETDGDYTGHAEDSKDFSKAEVNHSPIKVRLYLYQGPCRWNRLFAPLGRAKEVLGVQHTKIFVFDETNIILTGANLSDDYFATRMDRYIVYENNEHLAYFYLELLRVLFAVSHPVVSFSEFVDHLGGRPSDLALEPRSPLLKIKRLMKRRERDAKAATTDELTSTQPSTEQQGSSSRGSPVTGSPELSQRLASQMVFPFERNTAATAAGRGAREGHSYGSPTLHKASNLVILPNALGFDPSLETASYEAHTRALCMRFAQCMTRHFHNMAYDLLAENASLTSGTASSGDDARQGFNSIVFPTFQFGRVGIFHDSFIVKGLLALASGRDHVYLTSPYLNVYSDFLDVFIGKAKEDSDAWKAKYPKREPSDAKASARADDNDFFFDVITASVKTNGWNGHRGFAGYIPFFYLQLERAFYFLVKAYDCVHRVRIHEFTEAGLTFHAKGIYFAKHDDDEDADRTEKKIPSQETTKEKTSPSSPSTAAAPPPLQSAPYLVAYGSTNYGYRSVHKDVEAEGFFFTFHEAFREQSRLELSYLLQQSTTVEEGQFIGQEMGRFQPVISLVAQMGQDFL